MKLIKKTINQRFYEVDFKVKRGVAGALDVRKIRTDLSKRLKKEFVMDDTTSDFTKLICISDAHTHTERLAFPAFVVREKKTGELHYGADMMHISGMHTMMIHGGDPRCVYDDKVYIRHIRLLNKKEQENES